MRSWRKIDLWARSLKERGSFLPCGPVRDSLSQPGWALKKHPSPLFLAAESPYFSLSFWSLIIKMCNLPKVVSKQKAKHLLQNLSLLSLLNKKGPKFSGKTVFFCTFVTLVRCFGEKSRPGIFLEGGGACRREGVARRDELMPRTAVLKGSSLTGSPRTSPKQDCRPGSAPPPESPTCSRTLHRHSSCGPQSASRIRAPQPPR
jgi:hypothetical protein